MWKSRKILSAFKIAATVTLLSGCTAAGSQEFQLYNQAYDAQYTQGDVVLTALAKAERNVFSSVQTSQSLSERFQPNQAVYFVDSADPPMTASIRRSLRAVKAYNDAMSALANGESAAALTLRINSFASETVGAIAATTAVIGNPAVSVGAKALATGLKASLDAIPIVKEFANVASREAFREKLIASYPQVDGILLKVRDEGTPVIFAYLQEELITVGDQSSRGGIPDKSIPVLEQDRKMLSGWVLLLDQTRSSLKAAKTAATARTTVNLANLTNAAIELRVTAEQVKGSQ